MEVFFPSKVEIFCDLFLLSILLENIENLQKKCKELLILSKYCPSGSSAKPYGEGDSPNLLLTK